METPNIFQRATARTKSLPHLLREYPLISFFVLAYAFSWIVFTPYVLGEWGILQGDFVVFYILHTFGPAVAAIVMTLLLSGKSGLQEFRQRIRQWHVSGPWYLFILIGIPALVMLGIVVQPGALANFRGFTPALLIGYPFYYVATIFGVGLGEEPGWRGFALPRLQKRFGPLMGTLLLGVLWSCWHLPDFLTASKGGGQGVGFSTFALNFSIFTLAVVSLSVVMTWIFNHTHGSIFIAILAHASVDAPEAARWTTLFPSVSMMNLHLALLIAFGIPAIIILILTRGQLGYHPVEEKP